ncbi:hypothetical protein PoB_005509100 [Plakobranchus ocellatus]|uniref:Uncharacterized protein n=1 Tax=Plakobranchus ocellatus TaxID=259542 RepID=A0AAV4BZN8_9GAST|nr:hypothetical protein PoB_005509100 [Plakobranchus ocellatus]
MSEAIQFDELQYQVQSNRKGRTSWYCVCWASLTETVARKKRKEAFIQKTSRHLLAHKNELLTRVGCKLSSLRDAEKVLRKKEMRLERPTAPHKLDSSSSDDVGSLINGRAADLLEDSTLEQVKDTANRSRSTARSSKAEIDETTLFTGPLNLPGMNEFFKYLDASYRVKTKCRNGESGFIDVAEPVFSMLPVWKR